MSNAADRLISVFDGRAAGAGSAIASGLSYGTVTSVIPLVITRDDGAALTAGFLVLSKLCKPLTITTASHTHTIPDGKASTELQQLQIWPGLSVGEKVILLSFSNNQKFFVEKLERWENEV